MTDLTFTSSIASLPSPLQVVAISGVQLHVEAGDHSLWVRHQAEIEARWEVETAANPHLFNGQILLQERVFLDGDVLKASGRMTGFSTLLWWRAQAKREQIRLLFGAAIPVSVDGRVIVIRMAAHTANAGRICFAAGSLDASDIHGNQCDVLGSMRRELKEETGLDVEDAVEDAQLYAAQSNGRCIVFRPVYFPWTGEEIKQRVAAHMKTETLSEIDEVYALEPQSWLPLAPMMDDFTRLVVETVFAKR